MRLYAFLNIPRNKASKYTCRPQQCLPCVLRSNSAFHFYLFAKEYASQYTNGMQYLIKEQIVEWFTQTETKWKRLPAGHSKCL